MDEWETYKYHQAKAWLDHIAKLKHALEASREMVELFEGLASGIRSFGYSQDKISGSSNAQSLEDIVVKLDKVRSSWIANLAQYTDEASDAARRINQLQNEIESHALLLHYVNGYTWEQVCVQMGYSWQRLMEIRKAGVLHMYEHMPLEWRDPMEPAI